MDRSEIVQLRHIANAKFQAERERFRQIGEEETSLRQLLADIERQYRDCAELLVEETTIRSVGKDLDWMRWSEEKRRDINSRLALLRARKEVLFAQFRKAYGEAQVLENMCERAKADEFQDRLKKEAIRLLEMML